MFLDVLMIYNNNKIFKDILRIFKNELISVGNIRILYLIFEASSTNRRKRKSQWGFESKYCLIYNVCCITYPRSWHRGTQPAPVRLTTDDLSHMWITCLRWPRLALSVVTSASGMCVRMSVYPTEFDTECTESDTPEGRTQPASSLLPGINLMSMWKQAMRLTDRLRRC